MESEPITFEIGFYLFLCKKRGEYILELFSVGIRPPLYISDDHGQLKVPTFNRLFYIYYPSFALFPIFGCSLYVSMRFIDVLGGLADFRTTSGVHLPNGSPGRCF